MQLVASRDAADGSLRINQDARIYLVDLDEKRVVEHHLASDRHAWIRVLRGSVNVNRTGTGLLRWASSEPSLSVMRCHETLLSG